MNKADKKSVHTISFSSTAFCSHIKEKNGFEFSSLVQKLDFNKSSFFSVLLPRTHFLKINLTVNFKIEETKWFKVGYEAVLIAKSSPKHYSQLPTTFLFCSQCVSLHKEQTLFFKNSTSEKPVKFLTFCVTALWGVWFYTKAHNAHWHSLFTLLVFQDKMSNWVCVSYKYVGFFFKPHHILFLITEQKYYIFLYLFDLDLLTLLPIAEA